VVTNIFRAVRYDVMRVGSMKNIIFW